MGNLTTSPSYTLLYQNMHTYRIRFVVFNRWSSEAKYSSRVKLLFIFLGAPRFIHYAKDVAFYLTGMI